MIFSREALIMNNTYTTHLSDEGDLYIEKNKKLWDEHFQHM